ncbi:MAG TPA: hypothetical protein VF540_03070, partial [Segetibacter sp.]
GIEVFKIKNVSRVYKQHLTHQNLQGRFITITLSSVPASLQHFVAVDKESFQLVAFPKFINQYLQEPGCIDQVFRSSFDEYQYSFSY